MKQFNFYFIWLLTFLLLTGQIAARNSGRKLVQESNPPIEILFIGSSYFAFNNLPALFDSLATNSGKTVYIDSYIPSGHYLDNHASNPETEALINQRDWDYVILQGCGSLMAYPDSFPQHPVYPALVTLKEKIETNCENTQMIYCMPWAFEDGMTWMGWPDTFSDMQEKIYETTILYSDEIEFPIAPVGWAWYDVLDSLDYPLHYLHLSDWNHPSVKGSYLMACVIYSSVYLESTENNSFYGELSDQEAIWFQQVASDIVLDNLELWKLTDTVSNGMSTDHSNSLYLNIYPNPVKKTSTIEYSISAPGFVNLSIANIHGKTVADLTNKYHSNRTYSITFDCTHLREGIYYIKLKTYQNMICKKIIHIQ